MNIEAELLGFLGECRRQHGRPRLDPATGTMTATEADHRRRNSALILEHFGFGNSFWPTLEHLKETFDIGTRERVRQVIAAYYGDFLNGASFPALFRAAEILASRPLWFESEYLKTLRAEGLIGTFDNAAGLLVYMASQSLCGDYRICLPDLTRATRNNYFDNDERVIVNAETEASLGKDLDAAVAIPGLNGLAELSFVLKKRPKADLDTLKTLIRCNKHAWSAGSASSFWYAFENRVNVLVNNAAKTFAVVRSCALDDLASILHNSLSRRASRYAFPDRERVRDWISGSEHFVVVGDRVSFTSERSELSDIERATMEVMAGRGPLPSAAVIESLTERGFGVPNINKNVFYSNIVLVDRSGGPRRYLYTLVSDLSEGSTASADPFYESIRERLRNLGETDGSTTSTTRREQPILAEWVFRDSDHADCAICGRTFGVRALVVAHKKMRSRCTETERTDPDIVFPLCAFGCDYLYEQGHVTVRNSEVVAGNPPSGLTEASVVAALVGRTVDLRWIGGPDSYFDNLGGNDASIVPVDGAEKCRPVASPCQTASPSEPLVA